MSQFSIFSVHGLVLERLAGDPHARMSDLAQELQLTERQAQRVVADLIGAGHLERRRDGRRTELAVTSSDLQTALLAVGAADLSPPAPDPDGGEPTKKAEITGRLSAAVEAMLQDEVTFAEISVERLIRAAGISRSTFYAYFRDKDDLLQALVGDLLEQLWSAAEVWTSLDRGLSKDDLHRAMVHIGVVHRPHRLLMAAAAEANLATSQIRRQYDDLMAHTTRMLGEHILRGQREGFVRTDLDPERTAALLTAGSELRLSKVPAAASDEELARVITALADLLWNLLYRDVAAVAA